MIPRILIGACAAIVLFLGGVHLAYTLFTHKFSPTEGQVETAMKQAAPRISSDMTMRKAWTSFHVSHSIGVNAVRAGLWLPDRVPMGSAAEIVFPGRAWFADAGRVCRAGPSLLV